MTSRRQFFVRGAAATTAAFVPDLLLAAARQQSTPAPDLSKWSAVRAQFDLAPDWIHLSSFYISSHPRPVRDAIAAFRRAIDANPYLEVEHRWFSKPADSLQHAIREEIAPYLGAKPEEIAFTRSTTEGLGLVYAGLPLEPGDDVLTTTHDHYAQHESIRFACERSRAHARRVTLYEDPAEVTLDGIVRRLHDAIRPGTRVLGLTWVHSCTGVRMPIRAIADMVAEINRRRSERDRVRMVVDGAHGFGAVDEAVGAMGCDFLCAGTHKWMFGPRGTGIVWARAEEWARLRPTIPSFSNFPAWNAWMEGKPPIKPVTALDLSPGGFHAYEHEWALAAAFKFHQQIGRPRVTARIAELNSRCKQGLAAIPKVRVVTPLDPRLSAGIVCFEVAGHDAEEVGRKLVARKIVAGASPYLPSYPRFSPGVMNTPEEVEAAVRAVREIAGART
jgi:selenocysteine lyase/cysteine desulfurase